MISDNIEKIVMMNEFASSNTRGSKGPGRAATGSRSVALWVLLVSLLVALAAVGCSGGDGNVGEEDPGENTKVVGTIASEDANAGGEDIAKTAHTVVMFPQHDAPMATDRGGHYFAGRLVLDKGCLRFDAPSHDPSIPKTTPLLIWPSEFTLDTEDGAVRIVDGLGRIAAHVGDHVRLTIAAVSSQQARDDELVQGLSEDCPGPYMLAGNEITAFDPDNEPTELRLSNPDVLFLRQSTIIASYQELLGAEGIGELVLDGHCLRLKRDSGSLFSIVWPAGFTPQVHRGVVHIRNGAGRIIARVGDEVIGGGAYGNLSDGDCAGPAWWANRIKVLPEVEVYFPNRDGSAATDEGMERFVGKLVLDGKCLRVDSAVRVRDRAILPIPPLLIWPGTFTLNTEGEGVGIVDATGRIVARVGDDVEFSAISITYQQALEHRRFEEITPACSAPYWLVGDEFTLVPDLDRRDGLAVFPQQDGTLGIDQEMEHFVGKLVLDRRCLKVDDAIRVKDRVIMPGGRHLLIWPSTFSLSLNDEVVGIADATGRVVASVGDEIQFGAVSISYQEGQDHGGMREISPACSGGYWVVGEDFAAVPDSESP